MNKIIDAIVPVIILIATISGIITSIRESAAKKNRAAVPPPEAARTRAQAEIAAFLSGKPTNPTQPSPRAVVSQQAAQSSPGSGERPQKQKPKKQRNQQGQGQGQGGGGSPKPARPAGDHRPVVSSVSAHVDSFIGQHVKSHMGREIDAFVKKDIDERVKSHLGSQSSVAIEEPKPKVSASTTALIDALRSPDGVRHAILMQEILSRPKALR